MVPGARGDATATGSARSTECACAEVRREGVERTLRWEGSRQGRAKRMGHLWGGALRGAEPAPRTERRREGSCGWGRVPAARRGGAFAWGGAWRNVLWVRDFRGGGAQCFRGWGLLTAWASLGMERKH